MNSLAKPAAWEKFFRPLLAAGLLFAVWHYFVIGTATKVFPSPLTVEKGLAQLLHRNVLWADIGDSLRRVAIGFGLAAVIGIPLGLVLGWYPALNQVVNPVIQILRPISPIAWIPVAIVFFGVGERPAVFLIFLSAFFPILVACVSGVSNVPAIYRRAGRNFGLSTMEMIAVNSGLGYLVIDSRNSGKRYVLVVAAMLMIGLIGLALDFCFRRLET